MLTKRIVSQPPISGGWLPSFLPLMLQYFFDQNTKIIQVYDENYHEIHRSVNYTKIWEKVKTEAESNFSGALFGFGEPRKLSLYLL